MGRCQGANTVASIVPSLSSAIFFQNRQWVPVHVAVAMVALGCCPAPSYHQSLVDCWIHLCHQCRPPIPMGVLTSVSCLVFGPGACSLSCHHRPALLFYCLDEHAPSSLGREPLSSPSSSPGKATSVAPVARCPRQAFTSACVCTVVVIIVVIVVVVIVAPPPQDAHRKDGCHRSANHCRCNPSHQLN